MAVNRKLQELHGRLLLFEAGLLKETVELLRIYLGEGEEMLLARLATR